MGCQSQYQWRVSEFTGGGKKRTGQMDPYWNNTFAITDTKIDQKTFHRKYRETIKRQVNLFWRARFHPERSRGKEKEKHHRQNPPPPLLLDPSSHHTHTHTLTHPLNKHCTKLAFATTTGTLKSIMHLHVVCVWKKVRRWPQLLLFLSKLNSGDFPALFTL